MWKSILLSLLLQGMVSAVQAEQQQSLSLTLASDAGSNETAKLQTGLPHRDCSNLGYEVTLFSPCGDETLRS